MQHKTVSVATSATKVFDGALEAKHGAHVIIHVLGGNTVHLGGPAVTNASGANATGLPVASGANRELHNYGSDIYAAAETAATNVLVIVSPKQLP